MAKIRRLDHSALEGNDPVHTNNPEVLTPLDPRRQPKAPPGRSPIIATPPGRPAIRQTSNHIEPASSEAPAYLSVRQLAARLSVSVPTIWRWASIMSDFPKPIALSRGTTRWDLNDVIAFERNCRAKA